LVRPSGFRFPVQGDCTAFRTVWSHVKAQMNNEPAVEPRAFDAFGLSAPLPATDLLTDEEAVEALQRVLNLATSGLLESRLEAARIFCDLSLHDAMQQPMCDSGCVRVLAQSLITCDMCDLTRYHGMFALANLSEAQGCQEAMIEAGILPTLLHYVKDGPYNTAETRREAARILANLSARHASNVLSAVCPRMLCTWLEKVDSFRDERLKLHAERARESLKAVNGGGPVKI
jgi:hypothetical protein